MRTWRFSWRFRRVHRAFNRAPDSSFSIFPGDDGTGRKARFGHRDGLFPEFIAFQQGRRFGFCRNVCASPCGVRVHSAIRCPKRLSARCLCACPARHEPEDVVAVRLQLLLEGLAVPRAALREEDEHGRAREQHRPRHVLVAPPRADVLAVRPVPPRVVLRLNAPLPPHRVREVLDAVPLVDRYGRDVVDGLDPGPLAFLRACGVLELAQREDKRPRSAEPDLRGIVERPDQRPTDFAPTVSLFVFFSVVRAP